MLSGAVKAALALIYPPQCLACGEAVAGGEGVVSLCPACWPDAAFAGASCCGSCGVPLPAGLDGEDGLICDDCLGQPRPWAQARAALVYAGTGKKLVLALKHADRPDLAPALGAWLARAAGPLVTPETVVVPVPLHLRRLMRRKYNQAELLAGHVAKAHGLTLAPRLLRRVRHTEGQDHRGVLDRVANVAGALAVDAARAAPLARRPVLLVDDVMASGATMAEAAGALAAAGLGPIHVAVLARAVKDA
ncbi:Predicted amidophosphoribosyltransferases [Paracoccus tibetensis]|uniref:Predicted amidophosphoribosyltransferases n=1 Tax=Paracoccus tibetensis TaxID=336292 RepID=A0A1G5G8C8_9RHOB|nr:Predicted amidophosphoribosyltransferases [Paracoccus tibetensis]